MAEALTAQGTSLASSIMENSSTIRSFAFNEESNVSIHDDACIARLVQIFADDRADSERVTLETWKRRGLLARAQELAAALFEDQV